MHGLYRALINNMVVGVSEGYKREMEIIGVGFRVENQGNLVTFTIGFSHPVMFYVPSEIKVTTAMEKGQPPLIRLEELTKSYWVKSVQKCADSANQNLTKERVSCSKANKSVAKQARLLVARNKFNAFPVSNRDRLN